MNIQRLIQRRSLILMVFVLFVFALLPSSQQKVQAAVSITVDGTSTGRVYDGVGGLSGGGGTSRLLYDYPAQQQSDILDYLFKPNYGAALQILKVEIGSDGDSTQGAEASSQRTATDMNFHRGYEWWLMQQAKARNPNIKLYGLEWGAPSWFNGGFWSQDNINYIINWIKNAKAIYGLTIDYIGGWNEKGYNGTWYENLKSALQSNGLTTQIVADDSWTGGVGSTWPVASSMASDPAFNAAVDIVGIHYTCGAPSQANPGVTCSSPAVAQGLGKPLWASESGSLDYNDGAGPIAMSINRGYIDAKTTDFINWNLIAAYYSTYPYANDGLMSAEQPWSGSYGVGKSIWVMAQTAQFTQPGWKYLDTGSSLINSGSGGSYVSLKSTNNIDYSTIIETIQATTAQTLNFTVSGGLSTGTVHVWATNVNSSNSSDYFVKQSDIIPSGGAYSLTVQPGYVYTVTTTTGQAKGTASPLPSGIMSLPYTDNFESYTVGAMPNIPKYFATTMGAFEAENCTSGRSGQCMQQEITTEPLAWCCTGAPPQTAMGDPAWTNYTVSTDVMLPQAGAAELIGRMTAQNENNTGSQIGYHLQLNTSGSWQLYYLGGPTVLASGTVAYGTNTWTTLKLAFNGSNIQAFIGGTMVANITDNSSRSGQVGVQVMGWYIAQFDNFNVTGAPIPTSTPGPSPTFVPPTSTPVFGGNGLNVLIDKGGGVDNTQETTFNFAVKNTGTSAISGISTRIYFTLDGSNSASGYVMEKYYDQSGVATISSPTLACGNVYYFTVSYGTASLAAGGQWEFQTALHLSSWGSTYDSSNDWYHTGYAVGALPASYTNTNNIPGYVNGTLTWASAPNCGGATSTSVPATATTVPTKTFVPPSSTPVPPTKTNTPVGPTNTAVPPSNTPIPPTKTNTPVGPTNTPVPPTNTPIPPTKTNTPVGPTNSPVPPTKTNTPMPTAASTSTPNASDPCASATVITGGGTFNITTATTCLKYVNTSFVNGGMFSVMKDGTATSDILKWYGGMDQNATSCTNQTATISGNGGQLNNFTIAKDANGQMFLIITGSAANSISISIQNWQNGVGCSVKPTVHP